MTDEELAAIKKRAEAATPGPWIVGDDDGGAWWLNSSIEMVNGSSLFHGRDSTDADDAFVAHAREDIPALVAAYEAKCAEVEAWREIGREVAKLERSLPTDNAGEAYCPWCNWRDVGALDEHEATCPLKRIEALLGGKPQ